MFSLTSINGVMLFFPPECNKKNIVAVVGHAHITGEHAREFIADCEIQRKPISVFFNHITPLITDQHKEQNSTGQQKQNVLLNLAKAANIVFSVGPRMYDHFQTEYMSFDVAPTHYQYNPPLSEFFLNCYRANKESPRETRVLCFGRTEDEKVKGFDILAKAMGGVAAGDHFLKPILVVRGVPESASATTTERLQELADSRGFTLQILSFGTQADIVADLRRSSLAVMPSRSEPFGLVALEAIAMGVPALVSSQSGVAQYLKDLNIPDAESMIVKVSSAAIHTHADAEDWKKKITEVLNAKEVYSKKAHRIREYTRFTPRLTKKKNYSTTSPKKKTEYYSWAR